MTQPILDGILKSATVKRVRLLQGEVCIWFKRRMERGHLVSPGKIMKEDAPACAIHDYVVATKNDSMVVSSMSDKCRMKRPSIGKVPVAASKGLESV